MASYQSLIARHFARMETARHKADGAEISPMWLAVIDTRTGQCGGVEHIPQRVYRLIGAPRGSTLYWDQPLVVAAYTMAEMGNGSAIADSADRYFQAFLTECVDEKGLFQWGNHQYYDVFTRQVVSFANGYHELRPITPAWELFWRHDAAKTATYIDTMTRRHVYDRESGGFNRHDDNKKEHAFIESGGILAESMAWLHGKNGDADALDLALRIARYSFSHRGEKTRLLSNEPDYDRWDSYVSTTECGVWAQSLLRATAYTGNQEFADMAGAVVAAYLRCGFDEKRGLYYGQLSLEDGSPVIAEKSGYWPREHANIWNIDQWPAHDYPMALAEATLTLALETGESLYHEGVRRFAATACLPTPAQSGGWAYAESYGRCIHFLTRAGRAMNESQWLAQAQILADEAVTVLFENGLCQGYPGGHVYEAVDGVGYLFLALLELETGKEIDLQGFGF